MSWAKDQCAERKLAVLMRCAVEGSEEAAR